MVSETICKFLQLLDGSLKLMKTNYVVHYNTVFSF